MPDFTLIKSAFISGILIFVLGTLLSAPACGQNVAAPPDTVRLALVPSASAAPIYVALDRGIFRAGRLDVIISDLATGIATTAALLDDGADISWTAEFPFVRRAFDGEKISIIAVLGRFNEQYLFGLTSRGINVLSDLKGKTIGLPRNSIADFYLGRYLELNGLNIRDMTLVDVVAAQSVDAIIGGKVDAIVTWEPYTSRIREQFAGEISSWAIQNGQPGYGTLAARNDWLSANQDTTRRFLESLAQAEDYLADNPAPAKEILRQRLSYDSAFTEIIWSENQFNLSLEQSLILAMEDEARWMMSNNLTAGKKVPNFLEYINADALKAVKPDAVRITGE